MNERVRQLESWMQAKENEHFEFKEAKQRYDFEELVKYCVALANEGGGKMILGVTDKIPRRVAGTQAFGNLERTKAGLTERMHLRIDAEELLHPDGRVLVFHVPSRPIGTPIHYEGRYFMRSGGNLVPMLPDVLSRIFDESGPDYTAEVCPKANLDDLDPLAIGDFRNRWIKKSRNETLHGLSVEQLLSDAELLVREGVTYAALILFGKKEVLGRLLAQAEVIFEYRSSEASGPAQHREEFRQGFFSFYREFTQVLPALSEDQIKSLLKELKGEAQVYSSGKTRGGLWHIRKNGGILDNKSNTRPNTT